jgi:hypothetical protein
MKIIFAGDSWATKGYTPENYDCESAKESDIRLPDFWDLEYELHTAPGKGNLNLLEMLQKKPIDSAIPIVWIYTEPGRDYGTITQQPEFDWITDENIFTIRQKLNRDILDKIKITLKNPIALIGGLSDVDTQLAEELGFTVLHPSWQRWIAEKLNSQWFKFGWGASDIGWRTHYNHVTPGRTATLAWNDQITEWCWWEEHGYFCHEHPTPLAHKEFAEFIKQDVTAWCKKQYE